MNFLKKKTLNEVIKEDVGYLSNFTNIYIGKQLPNVLRKIKTRLKNNKSKIIYPNSWKLTKKDSQYFYQDEKCKIKLNTKNVYSRGMFENVCLAIKVALDLDIDKKTIQKTLPLLSFEGRFQYLNKGKIKKKLHKNEMIMIDGAHATADAKNLAAYLKIPVVTLFGSQDPKLTSPVAKQSLVITPEAICSHKRKHWRLCSKCMNSITPNNVYQGICDLLNKVNI